MGTLTYSQLRTEVNSFFGNRGDTDASFSARIPSFIQLAQQRLARMHDFREMDLVAEAVISNSGLPADKYLPLPNVRELYTVVVLNDGSSCKLSPLTVRRTDMDTPMPEFVGRAQPRRYTLWGTVIELFPLPDQDYTVRIRYTTWPPALVNDTDRSLFMNKDDVLIELAVSYGWRGLAQMDEAAKHEAMAKKILGEAEEQDMQHPDRMILPTPATVGPASRPTGVYYADPFTQRSPF